MAARARRRWPAEDGPERSPTDRPAPARAPVLTGHRRRRPADDPDRRGRRLAGQPGHALREAADARGHGAARGDPRARRGGDLVHVQGTSIPGATITVDMAGGSRQASADTTGAWSLTVDLRRGRNEFKFDATDPDTGKHAEQPAQVVITVPVSQIQGPTVKIDGPADGATFQNGAIPVQGTAANAPSVTIAASYDGPIPGVPGPSARRPAYQAPARRRSPSRSARTANGTRAPTRSS